MVKVKPITGDNAEFLWKMMYYAAQVDKDDGKSIEDVINNPDLAKYVQNWGRSGDMGVIAIETATAEPLGAAWVRLFVGPDKPFSNVDDTTPELVIAVLPQFTGQGIGTKLLQSLLSQAKSEFSVIALNVRADNPALRLYQRFGFVTVEELTNRIGGKSFDMRLSF